MVALPVCTFNRANTNRGGKMNDTLVSTSEKLHYQYVLLLQILGFLILWEIIELYFKVNCREI